MMTLQQFAAKPETIPASTSWYLADLSEARGKQELFTKQSPQNYETLEQSSQRWHDGKHDPWPYVNYLLYILKSAYREFEERVGKTTSPKGAKTELITAAISRFPGPFRVSDLQRECPGVSVDLVRQVLKKLRSSGRIECLGRGQSAEWQRTAKWK